MRHVLVALSGILSGCIIGVLIIYFSPFFSPIDKSTLPLDNVIQLRQVIGFLPYWLLSDAKQDYSAYITTLTYFGLNIDNDGTILKLANPQEEEPGWNALSSGKADQAFQTARSSGVLLSLLLFDGNIDSIDRLMDDPVTHGENLVREVVPLMRKDHFSDLNLDIEYTQPASPGAQQKFTQFIRTVRNGLLQTNAGTLTVEISPTDLVRQDLINAGQIASYVDEIVLMAYDYHYTGSYVTGPVSPLFGVGTVAEYDTQTAVQRLLALVPASKIILGVPVYGYEWETINDIPRSAIVPGSGITASTRRVASFEQSCATCSAQFDMQAQEAYVIYKDQISGTYHQIFYPNERAMQSKVAYATSEGLGGMAVWALGYEDGSILNPLKEYK